MIRINLNKYRSYNPNLGGLGYPTELVNLIEKGYSDTTYISTRDYLTLKRMHNRLPNVVLVDNTLTIEIAKGHPQSTGATFDTLLVQDKSLGMGMIKFGNPIQPVLYLSYQTDTEQGALLTNKGEVIILE